jgi:hypothetical protein
MCWHDENSRSCEAQKGQVLAEAIVVALMLVVLLGAVHWSSRLQFQWAQQWLGAQAAADAVVLGHQSQSIGAKARMADASQWPNWVLQDYAVGHGRWVAVSTSGRFAQTAWRLSGPGQASHDAAVTDRIERAAVLWHSADVASKAVIASLMPSIQAVEAPWKDRGFTTHWLRHWQSSIPEHYLGKAR